MGAEVMVAAMDVPQPEAVVAVPEVVTRAMPPTAPEMTPAVGMMEGVMAEGPSDTVVVAEETSRELSQVLTPGASHPLARDEPLLLWGSPQDPLSEFFTLDDAAEGMEREILNEGILAVLEALNHARGALRDVVVTTGRVFT